MVNSKLKDQLVASFVENAKKNIQMTCQDIDVNKYMAEGNVDVIKNIINKVHSNIILAIPDEVTIPKVNLYSSMSGENGVELINLTVSNKFTAVRKFKFQKRITSSANTLADIVEAFEYFYSELIVDSLVQENLEVVNSVLAKITEKAGVSYSVVVAPPMQEDGKKIKSISDEMIVLVADEDRVFELDDILVFRTPDEESKITQELIDEAIEKEAMQYAEAQTVEQFVERKGCPVIKYLCDISTQVRPMSLIKKIHSKNVERLQGNKDAVAYYLKDNVFAVIARVDGKMEVVLSPFDITTFRKVDVDVLANI